MFEGVKILLICFYNTLFLLALFMFRVQFVRMDTLSVASC